MSTAAATFTVQDLAAQAALVLDFEVTRKHQEATPPSPAKQFPDFEARWQRIRELGFVPPPASEMDRFDRIIAGEI
jgi:hypothetical protein